jgi:hypothetical protein
MRQKRLLLNLTIVANNTVNNTEQQRHAGIGRSGTGDWETTNWTNTRARFHRRESPLRGECLIAKAFEQLEQWRRGSAPMASIKWLREFRAYEPAL